ncbi:hypothetical protein T439DRAFT_330227 [Meredithblackwellia eburnea MCA 4105]
MKEGHLAVRGFHKVIRRAATVVVSNSSSSNPAQAPSGGQGAPHVGGAAGGQAAAALYNKLYANDLNLALLLGVGVFFFFISPILSSWVATGRFTYGWALGGKKKTNASDDWLAARGMHRVVSMDGVAIPASIRVVSSWYANFRYFYNKLLLPTVPFLDFTIGQLLVCLCYQALVLLFLFLQ